MDQLARFLEVNPTEATKIVKELERTGCVEQRQLLTDDEPWIWPRHRGARLSGTGFAASKPAISRLAHTRAINEARLFVTQRAPEGNWICERTLRRGYEPEGNVPDAVFEINEERHAFEVELTPKTAARLRKIITEHSARYDVVIYFCSAPVHALLERIKGEGNNPKLIVRKLPSAKDDAPPKRTKESGSEKQLRSKEPKPQKVSILNLLADQGAMPLDQLARFLKCDEAETSQIAARLQGEGLIHCKHPLADEPDWFWLTKRGAGLSERPMNAPRPSIGSLALMRATNEVRLSITERAPEVRWVSRRALLHEHGRNAAVPRAVVEVGEERHAIEIRLAPGLETRLGELISHRSAHYNAVVCFCTPKARRQLERLGETHRWPKLVLAALPGGG